jgi:ubiquinone/menaquinone biosynthesis C-methylase UbiE
MSDTKRVVSEHFGNVAQNYAVSPIHARGEDLQWLVEAVTLAGNERVLDVGTGGGHAAFAFAPHVAAVEGIDITPNMLVQAELSASERGLTNAKFSRGDVEAIPRDDATFDVVVSRWCAHHYPNIRQAAAEIARVLKPGGTFLLIDSVAPPDARLDTFINTLETLRDTGHVRNYAIREWLDFLEAVGLHAEVLHEWALRLDGDDWVTRIDTPPVYVEAIRALLAEVPADLHEAIRITSEDDASGWGFDLPSALIKATKI